MPDHPEIPARDRQEQAPDPQRIIDRIIHGRLSPLAQADPSDD